MMREFDYKFPFERVAKNSAVVVWGVGDVGKQYLEQIKESGYCKILFAVDKNHQKLESVSGVSVRSPECLRESDEYDYVILASTLFADAIFFEMKSMGIPEEKIISEFSYAMRSRADSAEDVAVYMIFKMLGKERFSYIDIGANHPYHNSNTAFLYFRGCRGICVEANPDLAEALRVERPGDLILNVGVGAHNAVLPYYMFNCDGYNTFSKEFVEINQEMGWKLIDTRQIPVITPSELIERYANGVWPDFLQIDIEGWDYDVLNACDFSRNAPLVICAELKIVNKMNSMLAEKGFIPFFRTRCNMIYLREAIVERLAIGGLNA